VALDPYVMSSTDGRPSTSNSDSSKNGSESENATGAPDQRRAPITLAWIAASGLLVIVVYASQFSGSEFRSVLSVGIVTALACLVVGGLLGFLFGIPRTLQTDRSSVPDTNGGKSERETSYQANTNLEQISDWLTKILVGLGLTQIGPISSAAQSLVTNLSRGLGGTETSTAFAATSVLFYLTCGFLMGYLWTRLYLASALAQADVDTLGKRITKVEEKADQVRQELQDQAKWDAQALAMAEQILNPEGGGGAPSPTEDDLVEVLEKTTAPIKAQLFTRAYSSRRDSWRAGDKAKTERTITLFRALIACDGEQRYHRNHAQLGYALKDRRVPDYAEAERELTRAIEMRNQSPERNWYQFYEFNRADCLIAQEVDGSTPESKSAILSDLRAAAKDPWILTQIMGYRRMTDWMTREGIEPADIES
jgi:hypothetical protein